MLLTTTRTDPEVLCAATVYLLIHPCQAISLFAPHFFLYFLASILLVTHHTWLQYDLLFLFVHYFLFFYSLEWLESPIDFIHTCLKELKSCVCVYVLCRYMRIHTWLWHETIGEEQVSDHSLIFIYFIGKQVWKNDLSWLSFEWRTIIDHLQMFLPTWIFLLL